MWLFHFSGNSELNASVNWVSSWINFVIIFFHCFYKTPLTCLHHGQAYKAKYSISEKQNMDCVQNVCNTKIAIDVGILLREITDKMLGCLDTGESLLRWLQIIQSLHKLLNTGFQFYPCKRCFWLRSWFLGFLKNVFKRVSVYV